MKQPKISILVPCCNVEKFIAQCLDSIVNQTLKDMEIIAINDGSTDGTLDIINKYAARDARIRVLDKPNEGYGKSMNRGLDMATGEYIGIVESDDWVDADMFESLVKIADANNVDVVKSDFYCYTTINGEENVKANSFSKNHCGRVIKAGRQSGVFDWPSIWSAIYRRKFLCDNNIRFLESPGASYQDIAFNFKVWVMAQRVYLTDKPYLHYRCDNANSSVKSNGKIFCVCDEWAEIENYLNLHPEKKRKCRLLVPMIKQGTYMWNYRRLTNDARKEFAKQFSYEFQHHIQDGDFSKTYFSDKDWGNLMRIIYPNSAWHRFVRHFFDIIRPIYKNAVHGNTKVYYIFNKYAVKRTNLPDIGGQL